MTKKFSVVVVVPTRNSGKTLRACLQSVVSQTYPCELWVVDNNSSDDTLPIAQSFTPHVHTVGPERSTQRNFGAFTSRSSFILFVDSDMVLSSDVVADCVALNCDAVIIREIFHGKGFWSRCKCLEKSLYFGTGDGEAPRFFTRSVFVALEGYDERLIGTEDIDLCKRVKRGGYSLCYSHSFIHHSDDDSTFFRILKKRYYYALTLQRYLDNNVSESSSEARFIRPAFVYHWRMLAKDPVHAFGLFVMRIFEGVAVVYGLYRGKHMNDVSRDVDLLYGK